MTDNPQDPSAQDEPPRPPPPPAQPYAAAPPPYAAPPPMGQPSGYAPQGQAPVSPSDARMWSLFAHLGGLLLSPIVPLVIYLVFKDRDPFLRRHAAQALNFQIFAYIVYTISGILIIVIVGIFTFIAMAICALIFSIQAAIAANKGEEYTYPLVPKMVT